MTDIYGSGLSLSPGLPVDAPDTLQAAPVQPSAPDMAMPAAPAPAAPAASGGGFGSSIASMLPGAHYTPPDPNASALDQSADLLQQRVKRASSIATNPLAQIFAPEAVAAARNFVPQATEQLQKIEQQKAAIQAGHAQAESLGLAPGEVSDQATQADRVAVAQAKALKGDMRAFQGLQAVQPDVAAAIAPQVYETVGSHLNNAQLAFDSLSGMENEGQYRAKVNQLRQDGTLRDLEALGLKLPPTFEAFNASKAAEGRALREARIALNTIGQKLEDRNTYLPMPKAEAETYAGYLTTAEGDEVAGGVWGRNGASGTRGKIVNGMATVDSLGRGGVLGNAEQREKIGADFARAVPKEDLEKYRQFNRIYELAQPTAEQAKRGDLINTNPNVQQGIAEGLASMLRGGTGGANVGLLKLETIKRGEVQTLFDKIKSGYAGALNTLSEKDVRPYLTKLTQSQLKDVLTVLKGYNDASMVDRAGQVARRAGALGFGVDALGFGKNESAGGIADAVEEGRQAQIERMRPYFQPIGGGNGVLQIGAQRPGAGPAGLPPGSQPANQLPGAQPILTPVQQASTPNGPQPSGPTPNGNGSPQVPPGPPSPSSPGGMGPNGPAPAPQTIAGQQVSVPLPPGLSPMYVQATQRIESGNSRDPWTATTPGSSASGAFQMIDSTWMANRPPGATATRAKDATPAQQAQALATLTAKNAAVLQANRVPVNDTNMYIAHNLGGVGATALLSADPNADARSIVGEAAARNNPAFFKGRPNVLTVLGRYQAEMAKDISDTVPRAPAPAASQSPASAAAPAGASGNPMDDPAAYAFQQLTPAQQAEGRAGAQDLAAGAAPAALSTAGALAGGAVAGPPGAIAGGAVGGGAGQSLKDYLRGNKQDPLKIAEQTALGGVLGVASEARPVVAAAGRVLGSAAIEGGTEAARGGNMADVADAALRGGAEGLGGEALGRFVSMGGAQAFKALSRYTTPAQHELSVQAERLSNARKTLETEQPKLAGEAGPNPKYEAAKKQADDATAAIKDHGQNPDDMVHAYEQAAAGTSAGEAAVLRRASSEQRATSAGYQQLEQDVREAGVGTPKANQSVPKGPLAQIRTPENPTGKVEVKFAPDAEHAEMLIKAPAKDWGEKWAQLQNAGTELINKRLAFLANGDRPSADAMDGIFKGVRNQQEAAAKYVFGEAKGAQVITRLEQLDKRWAQIMNATQGMNYGKMRSVIQAGNTPERRALEKNFREFAGDDPTAMRAFNAMKAGAQGRIGEEAKLMVPVIAAEVATHMGGVPTFGAISAAIGGHRMYKVMQEYMNAKLLGRAVTFKDFLVNDIKSNRATSNILGNVGARGAVQGDVLQGASL